MFLPQSLKVNEFFLKIHARRHLIFFRYVRDAAEYSVQIGVLFCHVVRVLGKVGLKGRHLRFNCGIGDSAPISLHLYHSPDRVNLESKVPKATKELRIHIDVSKKSPFQ